MFCRRLIWALQENIFQVKSLLGRLCMQTKRPQQAKRNPLWMVIVVQPFQKWDLDFVGPINQETKGTQAKYIIVGMDYCTKWVEARFVKHANAKATTKFIHEQIITRFGCQNEIVKVIGAPHFINKTIRVLVVEILVIH